MAKTLIKLSFITRAICPKISSFPMKFAIFIFSSIAISIYKTLLAKSFLDWLYKSPVIIISIWYFQKSLTFLLIIFPLSIVNSLCCCVKVHSSSVFISLYPLPIVYWSICCFHNSCSVLFAIQELPFIDAFPWSYFKAFSVFFTLTILDYFPASHVKFSRVVPQYCLVRLINQRKEYTVLIFLYDQMPIFLYL